MKRCYKCGLELPYSSYWKCKTQADGLQSACKACKKAARKKWVADNPDYAKEYYKKDPERGRAAALKCRNANLEEFRRRDRERYAANREASVQRVSEYNKTIRPRRAAAERERRKNPIHAVHGRISAQIREALNNGKRNFKSAELVGYSMHDLVLHLERQFTRGMTWGNIGEWHIDHIIPISAFKLTGPDDPTIKEVWALTNLRPLWAEDNLSKQNKRVHLI